MEQEPLTESVQQGGTLAAEKFIAPYDDLAPATPTGPSLSRLFRRIEAYTYEFQRSPATLAALRAAGFHWIRRIPQKYELVTRNPTIGCYVELYTLYYPGTVHVDSQKGRALVKRLSYF